MYDLEKSEKRCSTLFMGRSESEVYTIPFKSFRRIHALRCVSSQLQISNSGQTFASGGDQKVDTSLMLNAASGRWLLAIGSGRASPPVVRISWLTSIREPETQFLERIRSAEGQGKHEITDESEREGHHCQTGPSRCHMRSICAVPPLLDCRPLTPAADSVYHWLYKYVRVPH